MSQFTSLYMKQTLPLIGHQVEVYVTPGIRLEGVLTDRDHEGLTIKRGTLETYVERKNMTTIAPYGIDPQRGGYGHAD